MGWGIIIRHVTIFGGVGQGGLADALGGGGFGGESGG